jgi:sortase A
MSPPADPAFGSVPGEDPSTSPSSKSSPDVTKEVSNVPSSSSPVDDNPLVGPTPTSHGVSHVVAQMTAPRFGDSWSWPVRDNVDLASLARGVGHLPSSDLPGTFGNMVVVGHRVTHGGPFNHADELVPGDRLNVSFSGRVFVYTVMFTRVVEPNDLSMLASVPFSPKAKPDGSYLTLITCTPKFSTSHRLVVVASLVS